MTHSVTAEVGLTTSSVAGPHCQPVVPDPSILLGLPCQCLEGWDSGLCI